METALHALMDVEVVMVLAVAPLALPTVAEEGVQATKLLELTSPAEPAIIWVVDEEPIAMGLPMI